MKEIDKNVENDYGHWCQEVHMKFEWTWKLRCQRNDSIRANIHLSDLIKLNTKISI